MNTARGETSRENHPINATVMEHGQSTVHWIHEVVVDGAVALRTGRRGTELIAQWPTLGTLTCAHDGTRATFEAVPGASRRDVKKLQGAQVRGLLRDLAGQLAVHASAVAVGGRAVLFLGSDGAGKSTAAAEMCLHHGAQILADDAASLDVTATGVSVLPAEEEHWLTRESLRALGVSQRGLSGKQAKRTLRTQKPGLQSYPLTLVLVLRFDASLTSAVLRPIRGGDAARWLLEAAIRFDVEDGVARERELEQLMKVYSAAPFLELVRPPQRPGGVAAYVMGSL